MATYRDNIDWQAEAARWRHHSRKHERRCKALRAEVQRSRWWHTKRTLIRRMDAAFAAASESSYKRRHRATSGDR